MYGDFPQLENGVGMIPLFLEESAEVLESAETLSLQSVTVVTGLSPYKYVSDFIEKLSVLTSVSINLVPIKNNFFGDEVTVTGLVTGSDIVENLKGTDRGSVLLIPDVMLKEGEGLFLDEMSLDDIKAELLCEVHSFESSPEGFYQKLVEMSEGRSSFS
jgi:NifB/MoaA-like Fe-S oxidoreductase